MSPLRSARVPGCSRSARSSIGRNAALRGARGLALILGAAIALGALKASAADAAGAARLDFSLAVETRYEALDGAFRAGTDDDGDGILVNRIEALAEGARPAAGGVLSGALEIWDARAWLHDSRTPVNAGSVNALEPIQAWVAWSRADDARPLRVRAGRLTRDLGSRRLVARNIYRNTTNSFTGADVDFSAGPWSLTALAYTPLQRLPAGGSALRDDEIELDEGSLERMLYGVFASRALTENQRLELYVYHLNEGDTGEAPSLNRKYTTPGLRWRRLVPEAGGVDLELELIGQFGERRASAAVGDLRELDHSANFVHAELGWQRRRGGTRFSLEYDRASGDDDPTDGDSGTFDQLFGVIVGDYGPSGIWTSANRSNLAQWVLRAEGDLSPRVRAHVLLRSLALAERRDRWVVAGLFDPTGASGDDLGTQLETRLRAWLVPEHLRLEVGAVYFDRGRFARRAPGAPSGGDAFYTWLAARFIL